eukprot:7303575-Pyramimonas_sp.AAC.1
MPVLGCGLPRQKPVASLLNANNTPLWDYMGPLDIPQHHLVRPLRSLAQQPVPEDPGVSVEVANKLRFR